MRSVIRVGATMLIGLALVACDTTTPPSSLPAPSVASSAAAVPERTQPVTVPESPRPTTAACVPVDLERETVPVVTLIRESNPEGDRADGLLGRSVLGDRISDRGAWHQPSPAAAMVVERGEPLLLVTQIDEGDANCMRSIAVDAAPFSPLAVGPMAGELTRLASVPSSGVELAALPFAAPLEPGEWVLRVSVGFTTDPGPSSEESFFRLRVEVPAPVVGGSATSPVSCEAPGEHPPAVFLSVEGGSGVRAESGTFGWRGIFGDAGEPIGPRVEASPDAPIRIRIGGNVCAAWWRVELSPQPATEWENLEPFADLVPGPIEGTDVPPVPVNRFGLDDIPPGAWVVRALLQFVERGDRIGDTSSYWNVVVPSGTRP